MSTKQTYNPDQACALEPRLYGIETARVHKNIEIVRTRSLLAHGAKGVEADGAGLLIARCKPHGRSPRAHYLHACNFQQWGKGLTSSVMAAPLPSNRRLTAGKDSGGEREVKM